MSVPYGGQTVAFNIAASPAGSTAYGLVMAINGPKVDVRGFTGRTPQIQWGDGLTWQGTPAPGTDLTVCWPANPAEQS